MADLHARVLDRGAALETRAASTPLAIERRVAALEALVTLQAGRAQCGVSTDAFSMQPIVRDADGVVRFRVNRIVRVLLSQGPITLNTLATMDFSDDERAQFAQLIGYSVSSFGDLSYASEEMIQRADTAAEQLLGAKSEGAPK